MQRELDGAFSVCCPRNFADGFVTMWGIVKAENRQHTVNGDARYIVRYQDDGLLFVLVCVVGVCLSEHNINLTPGVANTRGPPFLHQTSKLLYKK